MGRRVAWNQRKGRKETTWEIQKRRTSKDKNGKGGRREIGNGEEGNNKESKFAVFHARWKSERFTLGDAVLWRFGGAKKLNRIKERNKWH